VTRMATWFTADRNYDRLLWHNLARYFAELGCGHESRAHDAIRSTTFERYASRNRGLTGPCTIVEAGFM